MGWKPFDLYGVSVPEFYACFEAWKKLNTPAEPERMTRDELHNLIEQHGL